MQEDEANSADETQTSGAFYGFSFLQIDVCSTGRACTPNGAIFCNNAPQSRGEENGLLTPAGSEGGREEDGGASGASFPRAAADQTDSMALTEGES